MIMSVQEVRGRLDCGLEGVPESISNDRVRGIRIFDVSDFRKPTQVAAVQTCRGSHTHTIAQDADENGNIYVYVSGTSRVRDDEELMGCSDDSPFENPESALFRIEVIEIPEDNPAEAKIVNRPFIFSDPDSGTLAGLWDGGDHGEGTQTTSQTNQCHDITTYPEIGLAAGACSGNGILLDISDPADPKRLDQVIDPGFAYWHSATFNNDGTKVIFTDEWGGGGRPRCRAQDPLTWGADAFYDIVEGKLEFRSHYKMSAPQTETENCVAHNGSLIPVPGRIFSSRPGIRAGYRWLILRILRIQLRLPSSTEGRLTPKNLLRQGTGRHTGITVVYTALKFPAGWMYSKCSRATFSQKTKLPRRLLKPSRAQ